MPDLPSELRSTATELNGLFVGIAELRWVELVENQLDPLKTFEIRCTLLDGQRSELQLSGRGSNLELAMTDAVQTICIAPCDLKLERLSRSDGTCQWTAEVRAVLKDAERCGIGKFVSESTAVGAVLATLRAINHAGLLRPNLRANNQKQLRQVAKQALDDLTEALALGNLASRKELEAEGILLEHINRVASAAVLTATNHPSHSSVLNLFDTSAWLYDLSGKRRDSITTTDHWLAWYPGLENDALTARQVIETMPAASEKEIPWIVRVLENPESYLRFRGAVSLGDHDVMHVLLGRGLQDQDEAFVIGFAMGTAKRPSGIQSRVLKFFLSRLYPEPYRVPKFLLPAFDLGLECGRKTGVKDLCKQNLQQLMDLPLSVARKQSGIDVEVLKEFYRREQEQIPMTIASVRLPS